MTKTYDMHLSKVRLARMCYEGTEGSRYSSSNSQPQSQGGGGVRSPGRAGSWHEWRKVKCIRYICWETTWLAQNWCCKEYGKGILRYHFITFSKWQVENKLQITTDQKILRLYSRSENGEKNYPFPFFTESIPDFGGKFPTRRQGSVRNTAMKEPIA